MKKITYLFLFIVLIYFTCSKDSGNAGSGENGKAGSYARFAVKGDYLYAVNDNELKVFDVSQESKPKFVKSNSVGFGIETIFPYNNLLFIGSQFGMFIYDINEGVNPIKVSNYQHIYSCDPVVVEDSFAFVTLHSENSRCGRFTNELQIIDISNLDSPFLLKTVQMTNPLGLAVDSNTLFVCDRGLKVLDISDLNNIVTHKYFKINATDVIADNGNLMVIGADGLYQYSYANDTIQLLSTIRIGQ